MKYKCCKKVLSFLSYVLLKIILPLFIVSMVILMIWATCEHYNVIDYIIAHTNWDCVIATGTIFASIIALLALIQAKRINSRSYFDQRFTHLLESLKTFMADRRLSTCTCFYRLVNVNNRDTIDNILTSFRVNKTTQQFDYCKNDPFVFSTFLLLKTGVSMFKNDGGLTARELFNYWERFCERLVYNSEFQRCFKALYHIVMFVEESSMNYKVKHQYMSIIKSSLSNDFLFCYMINLFVYNDGGDRKYVSRLRNYGFFDDLFADEYYRGVIKKALPHDMFSLYLKKQ